MARILLVEDDRDLSVIVRDSLLAYNHVVDHAATGPDARQKLTGSQFDLIIMDWDLPGATGVELVEEFRLAGGMTPILMLTGRTAIQEKEVGLEAGADDYLTKPFLMRELQARVKSLLRRVTDYAPEKKETEIAPGAVLGGKYLLEEVIGEGGMATVWKARHVNMPKSMVIKVLQPHLATKPSALKRFDHECKAMSLINHPNVVNVTDFEYLPNGQPFLVLEYVQGDCLREIIEANGALPVWVALEIMVQLCQGLAEAHRLGIVHRDLKPDNILIQDRTDKPDWVKIVDFGIALLADTEERLTQDGMIVGTVEYISPEQINETVIDARADIYALGVVLFEMLTGKLPFDGKTPHAILMKKLMEDPERLSASRPDLPAGCPAERIVSKALERDREKRYQTVEQLREDIEQELFKTQER